MMIGVEIGGKKTKVPPFITDFNPKPAKVSLKKKKKLRKVFANWVTKTKKRITNHERRFCAKEL